MKKTFLLFAAAAALMAACADSTTAPPVRSAPAKANHDDLACQSGYVLAYDENGNPICVPESDGDQGGAASRPLVPAPRPTTPATPAPSSGP